MESIGRSEKGGDDVDRWCGGGKEVYEKLR